MDAGNNNSVVNTYVYANSQPLAQYDGTQHADSDKHFYLHDRLGSVRLMIDESGDVANVYTYKPYGELIATETTESAENPFKFTGQWFDDEIDQYYLRARMYDPDISRFTSRDPVQGKFAEPLTLHVYLYCANDPVDRIDLDGRFGIVIGGSLSASFNDVSHLISKVTKKAGIVTASLFRQAVIVQLMNEFGGKLQGSVGISTVFGFSNESWEPYIGSLYWLSGGVSTNAGLSAMCVYGLSLNANRLSDFEGPYMEVGVSQTEGGFGAGAGAIVGISVSRGYGNDITLVTAGWGVGVTSGQTTTAFYGGFGRAWVAEWY